MRRILVGSVLLALLIPVATASALTPASVGEGTFQEAVACGCHAALHEQWSASMHAQALKDPLYRVKLEEGDKATDGALSPFCNSCRGPAATMEGWLKKSTVEELSGAAGESIGCDTCHRVLGTSKPMGNTSLIVSTRPEKRAQWDDSVSPAHGTAFSEFHTKAEFCGSCHNVDHPVNGMHLEATYSERIARLGPDRHGLRRRLAKLQGPHA